MNFFAMVRAWFFVPKEKDEGVAKLGFVRSMVSAIMACFAGCFRIRDRDSRERASEKLVAPCDNHDEHSSLLRSDDDLLRNRGKARNPLPEVEARELKIEANFLKACGTLPETPPEIRKSSASWMDNPAQIEESHNFHSWLPTASIEYLILEKQPDQTLTPAKPCEDLVSEAGRLVSSPSSSMTDGQNTRRSSITSIQSSDNQNAITPIEHVSEISPASPGPIATSLQTKNKSVRFEIQPDNSSTFSSKSSSSEASNNYSEPASNSRGFKPSPFPTPFKLTDDMQTPGTVFPAYSNNLAAGKANKVRSQYVYSTLNPIENPSIWQDLKIQDSESNSTRDESSEQNGEEALIPVSDTSVSDNPNGTTTTTTTSTNDQFGLNSGEKVRLGWTPGDRQIFGTVAAHWINMDSSHVSPRWDGNGIPNSTSKYKEDQKVSWHATPFEVRLEKALSEEPFVSQRGAVEYNDTEESDTASSQVETVVSF